VVDYGVIGVRFDALYAASTQALGEPRLLESSLTERPPMRGRRAEWRLVGRCWAGDAMRAALTPVGGREYRRCVLQRRLVECVDQQSSTDVGSRFGARTGVLAESYWATGSLAATCEFDANSAGE
jgi:hypothetical protein